MHTLRPVSMQRICRVIGADDLCLEGTETVIRLDLDQEWVLTCSLDDPSVLHFKAQSKRRFRGPTNLEKLGRFVTLSNRSRAFPKAYVEIVRSPSTYTVSAEVNRLVASGLSDLQFNAFVEHALYTLASFFKEFERQVPDSAVNQDGSHLAQVIPFASKRNASA